jgi:hypothetical protein
MMTLTSVGRGRFFQMLFVRPCLKHGKRPSILLDGANSIQHNGGGNQKLVYEATALPTREASFLCDRTWKLIVMLEPVIVDYGRRWAI